MQVSIVSGHILHYRHYLFTSNNLYAVLYTHMLAFDSLQTQVCKVAMLVSGYIDDQDNWKRGKHNDTA